MMRGRSAGARGGGELERGWGRGGSLSAEAARRDAVAKGAGRGELTAGASDRPCRA